MLFFICNDVYQKWRKHHLQRTKRVTFVSKWIRPMRLEWERTVLLDLVCRWVCWSGVSLCTPSALRSASCLGLSPTQRFGDVLTFISSSRFKTLTFIQFIFSTCPVNSLSVQSNHFTCSDVVRHHQTYILSTPLLIKQCSPCHWCLWTICDVLNPTNLTDRSFDFSFTSWHHLRLDRDEFPKITP